jgi:hypothetical protein
VKARLGRSRCRRPPPSGPRSCEARSRACGRAWPSSTWRGSTSGWRRSRNAAPPRPGAQAHRRAAGGLLAERNRVEEELAAAAGRGDGATSALYRLRSAVERLELRRDAARELCDRLRIEPLPRTRSNPEREAAQEQARLARERLAALEHSLAEREGLPPAARALAEEGERLALSSARGRRRLRARGRRGPGQAGGCAGCGRRARRSASSSGARRRARRPRRARAAAGERPTAAARRREPLSSRVRAPGGERVASARRRLAGRARDLERPRAACSSRGGHCFDASAASSGSRARRRRRCCCSSTRAAARWREAEELERRAEALPAEAPPVPTGRSRARRALAAVCRRRGRGERFEAPLRARVDAGATRPAGARNRAAPARRGGGPRSGGWPPRQARRAGAIDVERARLEAEAGEARRRLEEAAPTPPRAPTADELA